MSIAGSDFALGGGGSGGVTQIVAGTNITVTPAGGTGIVTVNSTGGGASNGLVVRKFPWTSATSGLFTPSTGWTFYTGTTGDLLHDIFIEIDNLAGSAAFMDVGTFVSGQTTGFWRAFSDGAAVDIHSAGHAYTSSMGVGPIAFTGLAGYASNLSAPASLAAAAIQESPALNTNFGTGVLPMKWTAAQPLIAVATQTGLFNATAVTTPAPASGTIFLLTSTPA